MACQNIELTGNSLNTHHVLHLVQKLLPCQSGTEFQAPRLMRRFLGVAFLVGFFFDAEGLP